MIGVVIFDPCQWDTSFWSSPETFQMLRKLLSLRFFEGLSMFEKGDCEVVDQLHSALAFPVCNLTLSHSWILLKPPLAIPLTGTLNRVQVAAKNNQNTDNKKEGKSSRP